MAERCCWITIPVGGGHAVVVVLAPAGSRQVVVHFVVWVRIG
jgi:hypothetical protein